MVAQVEQLVQRETVFAHIVLAHVELHPLARLLQLRKSSLALNADRHDASGDGDLDLLARFKIGGELFGGHRVILRAQLRDGERSGVAIGIGRLGEAQAGLLAQLGDLPQLLAPLVVQPLFKLRFDHGCSCLAKYLMPGAKAP